MTKWLIIGTVVVVVGIFALGGLFLWQNFIYDYIARTNRLPFSDLYLGDPHEARFLEDEKKSSPSIPEETMQGSDTSTWQSKIKSCIDNLSLLDSIVPQVEDYGVVNTDRKPIEGVLEITEKTSRGCITLPEDLYPRSEREFIAENDAGLGYVSNWEEACGGIHVGPIGDNCTGDGYDFRGNGTVLFKARSVVTDVPDINFRFIIK
ncbi:MAG TPA: hypothetical protein VJC15_03500 [Candidatus Paceibacterota bacterium]